MNKTETAVSDKVEGTAKRTASPSQTLKSFKGVIKNLEGNKLLNKEDIKTIKELHEKSVKQYLGYELL